MLCANTMRFIALRLRSPPRMLYYAFLKHMNQLEQFSEIIGMYRQHGWRLARALLRTETRHAFDAALSIAPDALFQDADVRESAVDALWFARRSGQTGREAWELRLVSGAAYALFETFEANEAEEDREDVRREMEARLIEKTLNARSA